MSADPLAVTLWSLLAIAPAPVAAAAAFAPAPVNRLAAAAGVLILVAGIAGGILHTGLFFIPALVALAVGGIKLWHEQPLTLDEGVVDISLPDPGPAGGTGTADPLTKAS